MHDKNLYWTILVYFTGLSLLNISWLQALTVGGVMGVSWYLTYGRPIIIGVGLLVLFLGFSNWLGLIPDPSHWHEVYAAGDASK